MIQPGNSIISNGQTYLCVGLEPYTRSDGSQTQLAVMESACAKCGTLFTCTVPAKASKPSFNRRCQKHKRPGHRINQRLRERLRENCGNDCGKTHNQSIPQ